MQHDTDDPNPATPAIRSPRNPRVKAAVALGRRRSREVADRYLVEGPRFVADLLAAGHVEEIFAVPQHAAAFVDAAERAGARLRLVDEATLRRLAGSVTPQGVVAVARRRRASLDDIVGSGFLVVLCAVADPGNAGAAVRTAAAAGAAGVVFTSGSVDPWNPKAVRASAGTVARLPLVVDVDIDELLSRLRSAGQRAVALDVAASDTIDSPGVLSPPVALLFGNETHGLPPTVLQRIDAVSIQRYGPAESLNLAAAVAVASYAAARAAGRDAQ